MSRSLGLCRWCREAVLSTQPHFAAITHQAVHAECMEEYLQQGWGLRRLAELAGFEYFAQEDEEDDTHTGAAGVVPVLSGGQRQEYLL